AEHGRHTGRCNSASPPDSRKICHTRFRRYSRLGGSCDSLNRRQLWKRIRRTLGTVPGKAGTKKPRRTSQEAATGAVFGWAIPWVVSETPRYEPTGATA